MSVPRRSVYKISHNGETIIGVDVGAIDKYLYLSQDEYDEEGSSVARTDWGEWKVEGPRVYLIDAGGIKPVAGLSVEEEEVHVLGYDADQGEVHDDKPIVFGEGSDRMPPLLALTLDDEDQVVSVRKED